MACCKRAAHGHAADQPLADDCCAGQEQTHQSGPTVTAGVLAGPPPIAAVFVTAFDLWAIEARPGKRLLPSVACRFHSPPDLLRPPLRI